jgi:hypothetical protein
VLAALLALWPVEVQRGFHKGSVEWVVYSINAHLELTKHLLKENQLASLSTLQPHSNLWVDQQFLLLFLASNS